MVIELILGLAVVALLAMIRKQNDRVRALEQELDAFRTSVNGQLRTIVDIASAAIAAPGAVPQATAEEQPDPSLVAVAEVAEHAEIAEEPVLEGPWSSGEEPVEPAPAQPAPPLPDRPRPDIETALGTRWAVWVGGIALALGGVFLVRYSIEAGIFGPGVRLTFAALFGLLLALGGELLRRGMFRAPVSGATGAYVPAILTAASAFVLFGTVFSAHAIYGFVGPGAAFTLLAVIALGTLAAALVHGQAVAGLGLLGSYATPILVASESPSPWTLFVYLSVVLVSAVAIASMRRWSFLATAAYVGAGLWGLVYLVASVPEPAYPLLVMHGAGLAALAALWLSRRGTPDLGRPRMDGPSIAAATLGAATAFMLSSGYDFAELRGPLCAGVLLGAMIAVAALRRPALPLLHAAGVATLLLQAQGLLSGSLDIDAWMDGVAIDGMWLSPQADAFLPVASLLAAVVLVAGLAIARRDVRNMPVVAASWSFWATALPAGVLAVAWFSYGNPDIDWRYATMALTVAVLLGAGAEWVSRAEEPMLAGGAAVSILAVGAATLLIIALTAAFGPLMTTVSIGLAAAAPAALTRLRSWHVLGWLSAGFAAVTLVRVGIEPTIVGPERLSTAFLVNALLPAYLVPALAFGFAAWQLGKTTDGRPRLMMEAFTALFGLLAVAMQVRHAMNGGVIDASEPGLAEQAIYTLIGIGAGGILLALDRRSPSPVFRYGSMAAGVVSAAFIVVQHFGALNPLWTNASTGSIPVVNVLLLAYLLPALALASLAWSARAKRPAWYVGMLSALSAALGFVYVTLSIRRIFQGEFIGAWKGMGATETYAYSAVWLALGVAILVAGVRLDSRVLRLGSAALVVLAVAKVFLFDMSELEGVLRALSFMGLGVVLIGIGLFYQRMLLSSPKPSEATPPPV